VNSLELRYFSINDAARISELLNDDKMAEWASNIPYPYSDKDALDWLDSCLEQNCSPHAILLENDIVGCISYWPTDNKIEIGYWVGRQYWGKGICTRAIKLLMGQDQFPKGKVIVAEVAAENTASKKVLLNCGFSLTKKISIENHNINIAAGYYEHIAI
jgi:ribosomal-protein-alanine N-acetyltransferase